MPRIQTNERGLLKVESKDSLRRRGVASPDRADALVLAFADSVSGTFSTVSVHGQNISSYDHIQKTRSAIEGNNGRGREIMQRR